MVDRNKNVVKPDRLGLGGLSTHGFWPDYKRKFRRYVALLFSKFTCKLLPWGALIFIFLRDHLEQKKKDLFETNRAFKDGNDVIFKQPLIWR